MKLSVFLLLIFISTFFFIKPSCACSPSIQEYYSIKMQDLTCTFTLQRTTSYIIPVIPLEFIYSAKDCQQISSNLSSSDNGLFRDRCNRANNDVVRLTINKSDFEEQMTYIRYDNLCENISQIHLTDVDKNTFLSIFDKFKGYERQGVWRTAHINWQSDAEYSQFLTNAQTANNDQCACKGYLNITRIGNWTAYISTMGSCYNDASCKFHPPRVCLFHSASFYIYFLLIAGLIIAIYWKLKSKRDKRK